MVRIKPRLVLQIPKLIALASVALRVQWRECDEHLDDCSTDLMAVGGVLHLDILSLPAPANKGNGWTLRPVTHDSQIIHRFAFAAMLLPFCPKGKPFINCPLLRRFGGSARRAAFGQFQLPGMNS